jgi:hypothetical protein
MRDKGCEVRTIWGLEWQCRTEVRVVLLGFRLDNGLWGRPLHFHFWIQNVQRKGGRSSLSKFSVDEVFS